jgi:putative flippase GtrA
MLITQAVRYAIVGALVVGLDYGLFMIAFSTPLSVVLSNSIAKIGAAFAGYWLHRQYTFKGRQRLGASAQLLRYLGLFVFNLGLSSVLIKLFADVFEWMPLLAKVVSDIVVLLIAFLVSKFLIYTHEPS